MTTPSIAAPPALDRTDAGVMLVELGAAAPDESSWETAERLVAHWRREPWPPGLLSATCFTSLDEKAVLAIYQWTSEEALRGAGDVIAGSAGHPLSCSDSFRYRRYYAMDPVPGVRAECYTVVIRSSRSREDAEEHIDAVLARLRSIPDIGSPVAGSFHIGTDGRTTLLYSAWDSKESHDQHMAGMGRTMADLYADLPAPVSFHQYRHHQTLALA